MHHEDIPKTPLHAFIDTELEKEIIREEKRLETYGGDSPHHPSVGPSPPEESDMISWDGPNDPDNPQNWSNSYKWLITVVCCLLTIDVYSSSLFSIKVDD